jgi:hypothetical protein
MMHMRNLVLGHSELNPNLHFVLQARFASNVLEAIASQVPMLHLKDMVACYVSAGCPALVDNGITIASPPTDCLLLRIVQCSCAACSMHTEYTVLQQAPMMLPYMNPTAAAVAWKVRCMGI